MMDKTGSNFKFHLSNPQKALPWPERRIMTYCAWGCVQRNLPPLPMKNVKIGTLSWRSMENFSRPNFETVSRIQYPVQTWYREWPPKWHHVTSLQGQKVKVTTLRNVSGLVCAVFSIYIYIYRYIYHIIYIYIWYYIYHIYNDSVANG